LNLEVTEPQSIEALEKNLLVKHLVIARGLIILGVEEKGIVPEIGF
jgi:hypothetical protein